MPHRFRPFVASLDRAKTTPLPGCTARLVLASALVGQAWASPKCPCLANITHADDTSNVFGERDNGEPCVYIFAKQDDTGSDHCYPLNYGLDGCDAYDLEYDPACQADRVDTAETKAYCDEPWCFVDPVLCRDSTYSFWKSQNFDLYWSYETCGGDETEWTDDAIVETLRGRTVRGAIPYSYYPMHWINDANGDPLLAPITTLDKANQDKYGIWIDYYNQMAELARFHWEWIYTSGGSVSAHTSSWTACVQDVQRSLIDICAGNFWTTEERLAMANFAGPTFNDNFYLFVERAPMDLKSQGFAFLRPFHRDLWLALVTTAFLMAMAYAWLHRDMERTVFKRRVLHRRGQGSLATLAARRVIPLQCRMRDNFYWLYTAVLELAAGAIEVAPAGDTSAAVMVLKVFWAYFTLVILAVYTANLAAMFTQTKGRPMEISSMDDCIATKCTLCGHSVMEVSVRASYPSVNYLSISHSNKLLVDKIAGVWAPGGNDTGAAARGVENCHAFLLDVSSYHHFHRPRLCDFVFVGNVVASIPVSQPVSSELAAAFSYWQQKLSSERAYQTASQTYVAETHGCAQTEFDAGQVEIDEDEMVLTTTHMWGLWAVLLFGLILACMTDCYSHWRTCFLQAEQAMSKSTTSFSGSSTRSQGSSEAGEADATPMAGPPEVETPEATTPDPLVGTADSPGGDPHTLGDPSRLYVLPDQPPLAEWRTDGLQGGATSGIVPNSSRSMVVV